jgi:hypothetical protein
VLVIYQPVDGERQEFEYHPNELLSFDAEAIEDVGGPTWGTYEEFGEKLIGGNLKARRAVLWVMLRRQNPRLRFVDLVVRADEVKIASDADDIRVYLAQDDLTEQERAAAERQLAELTGESEPAGKDGGGDSAIDSPSLQPDSEPLPNSAAGT